MKKVLLIVCFIAGFGMAMAQEETTFTDEDLTKYATVMVWAGIEKGKMTEIYNGWIRDNEILDAIRYREIKQAEDDSVKLQEIAVTLIELDAYNRIKMQHDSIMSSFISVLKAEIKETIGKGLYKELKKVLKSDVDVKARYKVIYDGLMDEQGLDEDETED
ncbi:hypothetical protein [Ekhidna sp.]|uniref:hypothetical protein n=1 Tax=Ekhidna sp. TaxID=2608089 RepID=UPI003296B305